MSPKTQEQIQYIVSTLAIEGLIPTEDTLQKCAEISEGRLTVDVAIAAVLEKQHQQKRAVNV